MKIKSITAVSLIVSLGVLLSIAGSARQADDPGVLLRAAIEKEEVEGDLQGAIGLYEQIIADHGGNHVIAAKAQLRIGMCFEKMGLREAQKAYQKVIDNYPDQADAIRIAKARIDGLSKKLAVGVRKPVFRKIRIPTELHGDIRLSPDGQKISLASIPDHKLWIIPISGKLGPDFPGEPVELNTEGVGVEWSAHNWSGDGKWIAFNEDVSEEEMQNKEERGNQGIYIVSSEGGRPRKIHENYRDARVINYRISLSPHGKDLAFSAVDLEKNAQHIYTIPVGGGVPKLLVETQAREPVFSPDGKMIAYVEDKNAGVGGGGLWVVPALGGTPKLVADAGKASSPIWSPEGNMIAFVDKKDKVAQIHFMPIDEDGGAAGKKITIAAPEGIQAVDLLSGWTLDDKIGAVFDKPLEFGLYTVPAEGGKATMVSYGGYPVQPRFSPDGKRIYHINNAVAGSGAWQRLGIAFVPAEGGQATILPLEWDEKIEIPGHSAGNSVSPDGKMIVFSENYGKHIWTLPVQGGKPNQLAKAPESFVDLSPCWSPDGKAVAFVRFRVSKNYFEGFSETNIFIIKVPGGEPEPLTSEADRVAPCSIAWSPDGKMIAFYSPKSEDDFSEGTLKVISPEGGESRVIGKVEGIQVNKELAWSPDSRKIAFNGPPYYKGIQIMSIEDGSIIDVKTDLVDTSVYHLDWSPDGKKLVFGGYKGGGSEFWLMEDFLPTIRSAGGRQD